MLLWCVAGQLAFRAPDEPAAVCVGCVDSFFSFLRCNFLSFCLETTPQNFCLLHDQLRDEV